jgi:predicted secreted protein
MNQELTGLVRKLNSLFWILTFLAVAFLGLGYLLHRMAVPISPPFGQLRAWGILLLILSVILGVALPILLRTLFNRTAVQAKRVGMAAFTDHQRRLVVISISAAYMAGVAYLLLVPNLYLYGSVLAGLYGIYSAIPSERKLKGEMRFYGVGG